MTIQRQRAQGLSRSIKSTAEPDHQYPGRRKVCGALLLATFLSGCAQLPRQASRSAGEDFWSGRLSLHIQSDPLQSLSAAFELKGAPDQGELRLSTPLGTTLLTARWSPTEALLDAENKTHRFPNIDTLLQQATGASVPLLALFDWLRGRASEAEGWSADLSRRSDGRITARRNLPAPAAQLRIVLDAAP